MDFFTLGYKQLSEKKKKFIESNWRPKKQRSCSGQKRSENEDISDQPIGFKKIMHPS
jgi:hypothetical protein